MTKIKLTEERNQLGRSRWKVSINGIPQHNYFLGVDCGPSTYRSPHKALRAALRSVRTKKDETWELPQ